MIVLPPKKAVQESQVEVLAVSSRDAAKMLGVSERTVFNLAKDGKIICKKVGWRSLYPVASIKAFLASPDTE